MYQYILDKSTTFDFQHILMIPAWEICNEEAGLILSMNLDTCRYIRNSRSIYFDLEV